ncbi:hydroxyacid dehydrogenase [Pseudonocardia cypriaca]|uniref:Phosphoglycerate dehydrogenase-like enzyme n=1 Tax=Pseudonocardia cypriaca TaxID=882449 RepID=A0A543FNU1_9PSEU|nr:hydroxyacid dehydrogenase [Pseudonocardia cypriaca]TQM35517.1 phosphoglycerate dehydrogenase-like enzyme [Pseudonocardia cypriaca]
MARAAFAMATRTASQLLHPAAVERIAAAVDIDPDVVLDGFDGADLADVELLITGWGCAPITADVLAAAPRLRAVVHTAGTVRQHVTEECWERGIVVSSAAAANAVPVAEYAVAMILLAGKRVPEIARRFRTERVQQDWNALFPESGNYRATVGLLGASLIGRRVADLLRPFDLDVLLHDPYAADAEVRSLGAEPVGLDELFARGRVVSLHAPLLLSTRGMVDGRLLALMRDGATLLNTARGGLVDHAALEREVLSGRLRAVLDVTTPEPLPADSPLWDCDGVVLTPHVAGSKGNELRRLADAAADEVERWAAGRPFAHPVRRELLPLTA